MGESGNPHDLIDPPSEKLSEKLGGAQGVPGLARAEVSPAAQFGNS